MRDDELWTIDELTDQVAQALAVGGSGRLNGRIREVPDIRTIRWYTTIGLLDRPAAMRGRTALYSHRHLRQLVAIKRLQAEGHSLAKVQQELLGATDSTLARIANLASTKFWTMRPSKPAETVPLVYGAKLDDGVTLMLDTATRAPDEDDLAAITKAAAPLLDVLRERGLVRRES